jgi:hypothetical protein
MGELFHLKDLLTLAQDYQSDGNRKGPYSSKEQLWAASKKQMACHTALVFLLGRPGMLRQLDRRLLRTEICSRVLARRYAEEWIWKPNPQMERLWLRAETERRKRLRKK